MQKSGTPIFDSIGSDELATLPAAALRWIGAPAGTVVDELTDMLSRALRADAVHVRLFSSGNRSAVDPSPGNGARRVVRIPIGINGDAGVITVVTRRNDFPRPLELALTHALASQAVAAMRYAEIAAREEVNRRLVSALSSEQDVMIRLGRRFVSLERIDDMLMESLAGVRDVMHAEFCEIYELNRGGESFVLRAAVGWPAEHIGTRTLVAGDECEVGMALRSAEPFVIADYQAERRFRHWAIPPELGVRCGVMAVIRGHGGAFGVLGAHSCAVREFTRDELTFHAAVATLLGSALEHRRVEAEREELLARTAAAGQLAEATSRTKTQFLGLMSHELRAPLNAIGGYVEILRDGIRGPVTVEQRSDLTRIARNQRYLLGLIENVLSYLKLDNGQIPYHIEPVDVDELLAAVNDTVAPLLEAKSLRYEATSVPKGITVHADRSKLQQIMVNLLSNAVKFTPSGGQVTLQCRAGETTFRIHVCDSGVGIRAEELPGLFEPFVQAAYRPGMTDGQGTGLGLSISREFSAGMGGHLLACSEQGRGSIFTLILPMTAGQPSANRP